MPEQVELTDTEAAILDFARGREWWMCKQLARHLWPDTTFYYNRPNPQCGAAGRLAAKLARRGLLEVRSWDRGRRREYRLKA
jgi:hypothetical protein